MDQDEITQQVIELIVPYQEGRAKMLQESGGLAVRLIGVEYGRKFSTEKYEFAEFKVVLWADRDGTNDLEADLETLGQMAKESIKAQALPVLRARAAAQVPVTPPPQKPTPPTTTTPPPDPPATGAAPPVPGSPPASPPPAAQGTPVKSGAAELTKIMVQADGKVEFYCKGFRYPFKDSRGAETVITLFDPKLGWGAEHLFPGALYEGPVVTGVKVDWEKPGKYYNVVRLHR
jgi:hypothetical protein